MATFLGLLSHFVFLLAYSSVSSGRIKGKEGLNFLGKEDSGMMMYQTMSLRNIHIVAGVRLTLGMCHDSPSTSALCRAQAATVQKGVNHATNHPFEKLEAPPCFLPHSCPVCI